MKVKIEEKGLVGEKSYFLVTVFGKKGEEEKEISEKGKQFRSALQMQRREGFRVYHGVPFKGENPHYFFVFSFPSKKIEMARLAVIEAAEGEGLEVEF